jgi:hypothetical protein
MLYPAVNGFQVDHADTFPTHQPLQLRLAMGKLGSTGHRCRKTTSAAEKVQQSIEEFEKSNPELSQDKARKHVIGLLHGFMDQAATDREARMDAATMRQDTQTLFQLITAASEEGFVKYLKLEGNAKKAMMGRGTVRISRKPRATDMPAELSSNSPGKDLQRETARSITQARRMGHLASRLKKICSISDCDEGLKRTLRKQNADTYLA